MHNWSLGKLQLQNFAYVNLKHMVLMSCNLKVSIWIW